MSVFRHILPALAALLTAALLAGCTARKNTAATRRYQAFITRYNVYYNGAEHYRETLAEMENGYEDDFTRLLPMHPAEARADKEAPQPSGSFRRSIEKAQKAIQLRSIRKKPRRTPGKSRDPEYRQWLKREEYNPLIHNAWMLMARSQYMDGDFLGAAATFMYIARHFSWLPETVTEARLWQARSYCAAGWVHEARATLGRVKEKELVNGTLKGLNGFAAADIDIASGDYAEAIGPLRTAIAHSGGTQRTRLTYLLGQLLQRNGDNAGAHKAFADVSSRSSAPYRTRFNARLQRGATAGAAQAREEMKALRRMARYDRNKQYLDQILYAQGNLLLAEGDTTAALKAYSDAVAGSTRRGPDMAIAALALGRLNFALGDYDRAQSAYAEAVPLLSAEYPGLKEIKLRSDVLDELAVHARNVREQDSLLAVADLPERERMELIERKIKEYVEARKKEREEEERRQRDEEVMAREEENMRDSGDDAGSANAPVAFTLNSDKSWYFYNAAVRKSGAEEFRRRWGGRKLEDNWRRRNKSDFAGIVSPESEEPQDSASVASEDETADAVSAAADNPESPEYYLKDIPLTEERKQAAHKIIMEGLYNMGLILKDKLDDYPAARKAWLRLLADYPDNPYLLDTLYNLYLMAMREGDSAEAALRCGQITSRFADTPLGAAMKDPAYLDNLKAMPARQEELYERAYADFISGNNESVRSAAAEAAEKYPLSPLMPKFMFLDALTYVGSGDNSAFLSRLKNLVSKYPDAEATPLASAYIKGAAGGREIHGGAPSLLLLRFSAGADSSAVIQRESADTVRLDISPDKPQMLMLAYPLDSVKPNEVLYEVARYNFNTFSVRDFDLEQLEFGPLGLLLVKGFRNEGEITRYLAMFTGADGPRLPAQVLPVVISEENFAAMRANSLSLDDYIRAVSDARSRGVHEAVLPPEGYPSPEEMYEDNGDHPAEAESDNTQDTQQ